MLMFFKNLLFIALLVGGSSLYAQDDVKGGFFSGSDDGSFFHREKPKSVDKSDKSTDQIKKKPSTPPLKPNENAMHPNPEGLANSVLRNLDVQRRRNEGIARSLRERLKVERKQSSKASDPPNRQISPSSSTITGLNNKEKDKNTEDTTIKEKRSEFGSSLSSNEVASVSLILSADEKKHKIRKILKGFLNLSRLKGAKLGELMLVGWERKNRAFVSGNRELELDQNNEANNYDKLSFPLSKIVKKEFGFTMLQETANASKLLAHYEVSKSPTWVVRWLGRDHIFEGSYDISNKFTGKGKLLTSEAYSKASSHESKHEGDSILLSLGPPVIKAGYQSGMNFKLSSNLEKIKPLSKNTKRAIMRALRKTHVTEFDTHKEDFLDDKRKVVRHSPMEPVFQTHK